ncbi:hypothetical protein SGFS_013560 [Streptomyces graminofaciens]|uniref:Uncharacterized protein n=1 Tax=Streptomyces graminofaciens TaxID=68212 RepID=A0ABM7F2P6_9ACTN|nr:hypothetical protein [Streptomyces graminofaciens]BBC30062.1 hypothetical protein SGFS_013560 [Streptomyces graminofaciens]
MQQLALFPDSDVKTDGYAQPEPRDNEQAVEDTDTMLEEAA